MGVLKNKIDFTVVLTVANANPNGDPANENRPRVNYDGYGEISDVCIKRKIRNRLQDMGEKIFVQSYDRADDGCKSLRDRADSCTKLKAAYKEADKFAEIACREWFDVRAFGQVFNFKVTKSPLGVRGPVTVRTAVSVDNVDTSSMNIIKSVNSETSDKKSSDTWGMKHRVDFGVYKFSGSINVQLAEKTGFTEEDAEKIHEALKTLFENDCSSARPDGSMEVIKVYWWKHNCKIGQYSSAKVHRSVQVDKVSGEGRKIDDFEIKYTPLDGLEAEVFDV